MQKYNLDHCIIGSRPPIVKENGEFDVTDYLGDHWLEKYLDSIIPQHNFDEHTMVLTTCEGFNSEHNLSVIRRTLEKHMGDDYKGKVIFDQGSFTFHKNAVNKNGIFVIPNGYFSYGEVKAQFYKYKTEKIDYARNLKNTFCVLYARKQYDRHVIFDHLLRKHHKTSELIYREHPRIYQDVPWYVEEKHVNQRYNNVYGDVDKEYKADDTARYILMDMKTRAKNCFVNVVGETNYWEHNSCWFTEKTVTSMITGFPFITSTSQGYYDMLKDFGFKTFSDFWDESYANRYHHKERVGLMLEVLDFIAEEYNTVAKRKEALFGMKHILEHNRKRVFEMFDNEQIFLDAIGYEKSRLVISDSIQDSPY